MRPIPILMYHNIAKAPRGKRLSSLYTHPRLFFRQMFLLKTLGYKGLSLRELEPYLKGEKSGKVFGISFYDGYLDNYENALPVLKRFGFTSTCYLVSGFIGKTNEWTRNQRIEECKLMNEFQVQSWLKEGQSIGSHSHSHAHLCKVSSEIAKKEIFNSKTELESFFNLPILDFCFPYGEYSESTVEYLKEAGYRTALTTERGRALPTHSLLKLPRVHMTKRTHAVLLLLKLFTSYEERAQKDKTS